MDDRKAELGDVLRRQRAGKHRAHDAQRRQQHTRNVTQDRAIMLMDDPHGPIYRGAATIVAEFAAQGLHAQWRAARPSPGTTELVRELVLPHGDAGTITLVIWIDYSDEPLTAHLAYHGRRDEPLAYFPATEADINRSTVANAIRRAYLDAA
jgi:hypothetical protein